MNFDKSTGASYYLLKFLSYLVSHHFALLVLGGVTFCYSYVLVEMVGMVLDAAVADNTDFLCFHFRYCPV